MKQARKRLLKQFVELDEALEANELNQLNGGCCCYDAIIPLYERIVNTIDQNFWLCQERHERLPFILIDLADSYYYQCQYQLIEGQLGSECIQLCQILKRLASVYRKKRNYSALNQLHLQCLNIMEKQLDPNHPQLCSLRRVIVLHQPFHHQNSPSPYYQQIMGTLLLNLGQCGCQIGVQMLSQIERSPMTEANTYLKRQDSSVYHSILVDTEPKILKPLLEDRKRFSFIDLKNIMFYQYGRGNNWGLGYMDTVKHKHLSAMRIKNQQNFDLMKDTELSDLQKKTSFVKKYEAMSTGDHGISTQTYFAENEQIIQNIIEQARREIEKTDYFLGVTFLMSLAGGTGSGLGSRLIEELRDILEDVQLNTVAIFPNKSGETPLQHYNCLLSLSHLQQFSDSIIYYENDKVYQMLNLMGSKKVDKSIDLTNVNEYIASCLMNMLWINDNHTNNRFYQDLLSECCVMPELKFIELMTAPFVIFRNSTNGPESTWEDMIKSCFEQFLYEADPDAVQDEDTSVIDAVQKDLSEPPPGPKDRKLKTLSLQAVFRSADVRRTLCESESHIKFLERKVKSVFNPVKWNPDSVQLQFIEERYQQKGLDQKMVLAMANSSKIIPIIKSISSIAYQKYRSNAYLHWYFKYGIERDHFEEAFQTLQAIDDNYTHMTE